MEGFCNFKLIRLIMDLEHIKIFTGDDITARRIKNILEEKGISSIYKEDKIVGYEISNNVSEIYVLNIDMKKAEEILKEFKI